MIKKIVIAILLMSLSVTPTIVSATEINEVDESISTYGSSRPTAFFERESKTLVLNPDASTYSDYIIFNTRDHQTVTLIKDPKSPEFVIQVEAFDYRTHELVSDMMFYLFEEPGTLIYDVPKDDARAQHLYYRFTNLSDVKGTLTYRIS